MGAFESPIADSENFFAGEDRTILFDVKQEDGTTPQNMTGWALTWELKASATGSVSVSKTTVSGITIGNGIGTGDRATVTVAKADTSALTAATFFHILRRTDSGASTVLAFGDAILQASGIS